MSGLTFTPGGTCICEDPVETDGAAPWAAVLAEARELDRRAAALAAASAEYARVAALQEAQPLPPAPAAASFAAPWRAVAASVDLFAPGEAQASRSDPGGGFVAVAWRRPCAGTDPLITLGLSHAEARRLFYALGRALGEVRP